DDLAVTNVDGLDTVERVRICTAYRCGSKMYDYIPNDIETFSKCQPVYTEMPGWKSPTHEVKTWKGMPPKAKAYLKAISELTGAKLTIASVGPAREQTLFL
ncbi:MAG TPA: adenylosuccinate synthetase, partial [Verrucomicrobiae bacterium]|nr:adenylosuccinate synthetase [Verrucomicrobiae bacterium]